MQANRRGWRGSLICATGEIPATCHRRSAARSSRLPRLPRGAARARARARAQPLATSPPSQGAGHADEQGKARAGNVYKACGGVRGGSGGPATRAAAAAGREGRGTHAARAGRRGAPAAGHRAPWASGRVRRPPAQGRALSSAAPPFRASSAPPGTCGCRGCGARGRGRARVGGGGPARPRAPARPRRGGEGAARAQPGACTTKHA